MAGTKQTRNFDIVTYLSREHLMYNLSCHWEQINWYAWMTHEPDPVDPNHHEYGLKQTHTHLVLVTRSPLSVKTIRNRLYDPDDHQNSIVQFCGNVVGASRYLMHLDDPNKYQYPRENVVTTREDFDSFINSVSTGADSYRDMVEDVINNWSYDDMMQKYGQLLLSMKIIL